MQRSQLIAVVVLVAVVAGLAIGRLGGSDTGSVGAEAAEPASDQTTLDQSTPSDPVSTKPAPTEPVTLERLGAARDLVDLDGWLQTDATSLDDFDGQVMIVQFWTFSCFNCKNTIPHLQEIYAARHDDGLEIIGIHAPEFDFEKDPDAIAAAAVDLGVTWPIALDTGKRNFRAWQPGRRFWPRTFVIDQRGEVRFDHIGEGAYDELEAAVAQLITSGP